MTAYGLKRAFAIYNPNDGQQTREEAPFYCARAAVAEKC